MAHKLAMRPWQAAMAILAETGNPGVMAGDSGLLSMIAHRCCMEFNGFKSEKHVLDALSREPGLLVVRHFRRIDGRDCRGFDLPTKTSSGGTVP